MKTTGTVSLATLLPGVLADALTPATSTTTLRSAAGIVIAAMAETDDPIAFAIKADGSRVVKFAGGTLSPFFPAMLSPGDAIELVYGVETDTTRSRVIKVLGGEVSIMPAVVGEGGTAILSGLVGRIVRALAGFDPVEADDATREAVTKTPLAVLNALSSVPGIGWVLMDQTDVTATAPRIMVIPSASTVLADTTLMSGAPGEESLDTILVASTLEAFYDIPAVNALGGELVEIDLPDVVPTTPTGPRLAFE